jgi:hypothetical protein
VPSSTAFLRVVKLPLSVPKSERRVALALAPVVTIASSASISASALVTLPSLPVSSASNPEVVFAK